MNRLRKQIQMEYVLSGNSLTALWKSVGTARGLAKWFADDVQVNKHTFDFIWNKEPHQASLIKKEEESFIRFHWDDEPNDTYFEMRIGTDELTKVVSLKIIDYCEPDDVENAKLLWNSQIDELRRVTGM